ncbi:MULTISPECIES: gamma-glutamylcyclotransferase family protein [Achromobacter]|jgi:gamma-glutamylcyclotransferase (GGCT)/AIG2-like uncharacterized protein YtfP|uniref:gamma-glutamylcyclotransferase family protein n=1 Tax=Achromobacter TaxID=222 RepID=UPI000CFC3B1F|nr:MULTISPECIES: gamma-glutamylcyclotransferase family protein [Achromobacter]MDR6602848.1 gamma-glutamylcyclotransferase (GGCT)/AIG2-like uncharacterized protein YtfP [Achromobacter deleyi]PQZ71874.1 UDP-N-acetylmuramate--alanine ligase [Achromobacter sp. MYb9]HCW16506.1 gamma-glutamylcyclotransferase [Achromobacter sp.]
MVHDSYETSILLFSYGTLQDKTVQLATFGRELTGRPDAMTGYVLHWVAITDPQVLKTSGKAQHPIVYASYDPKDEVPGMVFEISQDELRAADSYEVADYKRVSVLLKSGVHAWVYIKA